MGEMTIRDIAKRCGVGIGTVSRAINNHPDINPDTKRMVMDVIRETGFVPNNSARNNTGAIIENIFFLYVLKLEINKLTFIIGHSIYTEQ